MQHDDQPNAIRRDLLERLRALEGPQSSGTLSEMAYRRAREALEKALEEARTVRLQAIEDAKATRERELTSLMESLRALRHSAEVQIEALLRSAEIEAERLVDRARSDAESVLDQAKDEAEQVRAEAATLRAGAEARAREMDRFESEFNAVAARLAERIGLHEQPRQGWWRRLAGGR